MRICIDVGGTLTNNVLVDVDTGAITINKVPSTPEDSSQAVLDASAGLAVGEEHFLRSCLLRNVVF